jgi:hypothetical protein
MVNFDQLEVNRVAQGNFPPDLINPVFVLGSFCSISHGSTLRRKSQTDSIIHSKVLFLYLRGVGAGGALAPLPLNASKAR